MKRGESFAVVFWVSGKACIHVRTQHMHYNLKTRRKCEIENVIDICNDVQVTLPHDYSNIFNPSKM